MSVEPVFITPSDIYQFFQSDSFGIVLAISMLLICVAGACLIIANSYNGGDDD